jgi:hypothetical protein
MNEQFKSIVTRPSVAFSIGGVLGFTVGGGVTYILGRRKLEAVVDRVIEANEQHIETLNQQIEAASNEAEELKEMNNNYALQAAINRNIVPAGAIPFRKPENSEAIGHIQELIETDDGLEVTVELTEEGADLIHRNIFDDANDDWDYEEERNNRSKHSPYVIHADEYQADEMGWDSQTTLTWYEGDEILTDSNDVPIYNPHTVVGDLKFGHGSGDPNIVYIRNERLEAEYEVIREEGSYEIIVLGGDGTGIEDEYEQSDLKHSKTPLRFRE